MVNTYRLKYTAEEIDEILERADKEPLVLYYDKVASLYRGFSSKENRDLWIDDPEVNANLELFNFVAPAPFTMKITPLNERVQYILSGETGNFIEFSFETVDDKDNVRSESVDVTFKFDDLKGNTQSITQTYNSGEEVKFNVDKYLKDGSTNLITVTVEGRLTGSRNSEDWKFTIVSLSLTSDFNVALPIAYGKAISVPFRVKGPDGTSPSIEFILDNDVEGSSKYQAMVSEIEDRQEIPNNLIPGKHTLQARASVNLDSKTFYSNTKYFEFIVKGNEENYITIGQDFSNSIPLINEDRTNLVILAEQFVQTNIPWGFYSGIIDYADILWKLDGEIISSVSTYNSSDQTNYAPAPLKFIPTKIGTYTLSAWIGEDVVEEYSISVIGNTNGVVEASSFLDLKLSGLGRNNGEADPALWTYTNTSNKTYTTEFVGSWAFSTNQGWSKDALQISGGAQAVINCSPLCSPADGHYAQNEGTTFEIEFEVMNVNNPNAILVDITNESGAGIKITGEKASITSVQGSTLNTQFIPGERIKLAFIIFNKTHETSPRMMYIMNNGVYERGVQYSNSDSFDVDSFITLGDPNGEATIRVYSIRCYTRALTKDEEFKHYIIDSGDIAKKIVDNDILVDGSTKVSVSKMSGIIPTFLFTGDIDALLAANDKQTQRYIDVEFINPFDRSKNFKITHARMKLQGTSSLGYPRKNFKMYSGSKWGAIMYDFEGNVLTDGNYAFADGDVPVHTWTLKADFSDSSCTHNASVARLFGDIEPLVMVNNERVLMTPPQKAAESYKDAVGVDFPYKIRTTPNALAAVAFYRQDETQDYTFMGQYTLLNDKGNDEVYGFKSIYKNGRDPYYFESEKDKTKVLWDNKDTHCFEILDNTNIYSTFSSTDGFFDKYVDDTGIEHQNWEKAFESRYPELEDTDSLSKRRETAQSLYDFIAWIKTTIGNQDKFEEECERHLDLYKCAAYYIYLIRFGAVDQVQKNMMWTTYGTKSSSGDFIWFPIRYDNDTILGLANTGNIAYDYNITRQTVDPASSNGSSYCYAGHDSWLWNALEGSTKFMNTVRTVDGALYEVGLNYKNVCHYFDDLASDQWCERIYNDNQEYKYIQPLLEEGRDWMVFMQGKRKTHRHWWLKNRFDLCDALYVTGEYVNRSIRLIAEGTPAGSKMYFKAAKSTNFGWGINKVPQQNNVPVEKGGSFVFSTEGLGRALAKGDPVYIYCSNNIEEADFHELAQYLSSVINIDGTYDAELGTNLKVLKIGVPENLMEQGIYNRAEDITFSGFNTASRLEYLDVRGLSKVIDLPFMENLVSLKTLLAKGTGLTQFSCAEGLHYDMLELPNTIQTLKLSKCGWDEISFIPENLNSITFQGMGTRPEVKTLFWNWVDYLLSNESTKWNSKNVYIDGIEWDGVDIEKLITLKEKLGDRLVLKGRIGVLNYREKPLGSGLDEDQVSRLREAFKDPERPNINIFDKESSPNLYITAPDSVFIYTDGGKTEILEGDSLLFVTTVFSATGIVNGSSRLVIDSTNITHGAEFSHENPLLLTTQETGAEDEEIKIEAVYTFENPDGSAAVPVRRDKIITIKKRTYAENLNVAGPDIVMYSGNKTFECTTTPEKSELTGIYKSKRWTVSEEFANLAEIVSQNEDSCTVYFNLTDIVDEVIGNITVTYTRMDDTFVESSKQVILRNEKVAISKSTNPYLFNIFKSKGFCEHDSYMTKLECASILPTDLSGTDGSRIDLNIFNQSGASNITSFDEFQYFKGITSINDFVFAPLTGLKSIVLPSTVREIGVGAFSGCSQLESITFEDINLSELTTIKKGAFYGTSRLTEFILPYYCRSIDENAFYGSGVVNLGNFNSNVIDEAGWKEETEDGGWELKFVLSKYSGDFEIPADITKISDRCFSKCTNLRSLIVNNASILPQSKFFGNCKKDIIHGEAAVGSFGWKIGNTLTGVLPNSTELNIPSGINKVGSYAVSIGEELVLYSYTQTVGTYSYRAFSEYTSNIVKNKTVYVPGSVKEIENFGFYQESGMTSITIEEGLEKIGNDAFNYCNQLGSIYIPTSVLFIGKNCFSNCTSLSGITIVLPRSEKLTLGEACFSGTAISEFTVPDSVAELPDSCFNSCESLRTINLGNTVTRIGNSCFSNCKSLQSVIIPSSISVLSSNCFHGCSSLSSVVFPEESITSIGNSCFSGCSGLTSISIPDSVTNIDDGVFRDCTKLKNITLPLHITRVSNNLFSGCSSLESIVLPENITILGNYAFEKCTDLGAIELPESVNSLGQYCFSGCTALSDINLDKINSIGRSCLKGCISLRSTTLSPMITAIPEELFRGCSGLVEISLSDDITSLGISAFEGCSGLSRIVLPEKLSTLGNKCFFGCSALGTITLKELVGSIGSECFSGCTRLKVIITNSYNAPSVSNSNCWGTNADNRTGSSISSNRYLVVVSGATKNYNTGSWKSLSDTNGFEIVSGYVEKDNIFLTPSTRTIFMGESITFVAKDTTWSNVPEQSYKLLLTTGEECQYYESGSYYWIGGTETEPEIALTTGGILTTKEADLDEDYELVVRCTCGETIIEKNITASTMALSTTEDKKVITVEENSVVMSVCKNEGWASNSNYMYEYECKEIVDLGSVFKGKAITTFNELQYFSSLKTISKSAFHGCTGLNSIILPDGIERVSSEAFNGCTGLNSITLPNSVKELQDKCFFGCSNLETVLLSEQLEKAGTSCFSGCTSLVSITLPNSLTTLGASVFSNCEKLETVVFSENLEEIPDSCFVGCNALNSSITLPDSITRIGNSSFSSINSVKNINIPANLKSLGTQAFGSCWNLEGELNFPDGFETMGSSCFEYCSRLKKVSLPGIKSMGTSCFRGCSSLEKIQLSDNLSRIEDYTFESCSSLSNINIPKNLLYLGTRAFGHESTIGGGCKFTEIILPEGLQNIGTSCFKNCKLLESISIPDSVSSIGPQAFSRCTSLKSIEIPDRIIEIQDYTFFGCTGLESIIFPGNVGTIGNYSFANCPSVSEIYVKGKDNIKVSDIKPTSFGLIPANITYGETIAEVSGFENSEYVTATNTSNFPWTSEGGVMKPTHSGQNSSSNITFEFNIPEECYLVLTHTANISTDDTFSCSLDGVDLFRYYSDNYDGNGQTLSSYNNIPVITKLTPGIHTLYAYYYVGWSTGPGRGAKISDIKLVKSVEFDYTSLTFGKNSESKVAHVISGLDFSDTDYIYSQIFESCQFELDTTNEGSNKWYEREDETVLTTYPMRRIHQTTLSSGDVVDIDASSIMSASSYGYELYYGGNLCELHNGNYWIGGETEPHISLNYVSGILKVTENEHPEYAITVKAVSLLEPEKYIEKEFLISEYSDTELITETSNPLILNICKESGWCKKNGTSMYKSDCRGVTNIDTAFMGSSITSFTEFEEFTGLTSIPANAFRGCTGLTSIVLPKNIKEIGNDAFYGCTSLQGEVAIPEGVEIIGQSAFQGDSLIETVDLPETLKSIGQSCFNGCTGISTISILAKKAPETKSSTFSGLGSAVSSEKILYVDQYSNGYDGEYWSSLVENGFILSKTL